MPASVNVAAAKAHLSQLMDLAHAGQTVVLAKYGQPWALLGPIEPLPPQRRAGRLLGLGLFHNSQLPSRGLQG
jgi:antitoxin (DNA-binding transcriptional repressor) of toxin-antitoxin stability system